MGNYGAFFFICIDFISSLEMRLFSSIAQFQWNYLFFLLFFSFFIFIDSGY